MPYQCFLMTALCISAPLFILFLSQGHGTYAGLHSNQILIKVCLFSAAIAFISKPLHIRDGRLPSWPLSSLTIPQSEVFSSLIVSPLSFPPSVFPVSLYWGLTCTDGLSSLRSQLHLGRSAQFPEAYAEGSMCARHVQTLPLLDLHLPRF